MIEESATKSKYIIGISGASGSILAFTLMKQLKSCCNCELHLVMTHGASVTASYEIPAGTEELMALADVTYCVDDLAAAISSGSFPTSGMVVIPCSMKTVAGIVSGYSDNLLLRAADVTLKEGRKLIVVPRETPLSQIHLRNLHELSLMNNVSIIPPMMSFYNNPEKISDMVDSFIGRIMDALRVENEYKRWK